MTALPRLRQVALAAHDLDPVAKGLQTAFGWPDPFHDPGVSEFGLVNSVFAAGDTFVEVVSPVRDGTTAGRYLERRGGDTGYMAIFQVDDVQEARGRAAAAGIRVVWQVDLPDIAGTHLHPKDVPGAIVSLDWAVPPESWRWAGPAWMGGAPAHTGGSITGLTVEVLDPVGTAAKWAAALGVTADGPIVLLTGAGQELRFVPVAGDRGEGIKEVRLDGAGRTGPGGPVEIAGVRFA